MERLIQSLNVGKLKELQAAGFGILGMSQVNCPSFKYQKWMHTAYWKQWIFLDDLE